MNLGANTAELLPLKDLPSSLNTGSAGEGNSFAPTLKPNLKRAGQKIKSSQGSPAPPPLPFKCLQTQPPAVAYFVTAGRSLLLGERIFQQLNTNQLKKKHFLDFFC